MEADVIVLGGGAAGLAAARTLAMRSLRVVVLEARDRVGGRAWSRPGARRATPAELGAEFIHGRGERTLHLLRETGMAAIDIAGERWMHTGDGTLERDDDEFFDAAAIFGGVDANGNDESVERFLNRFAGDPAKRDTIRWAREFVEGFDAADPAVASVQGIAHEWNSGADATASRPLGGYGLLFARLHDLCAAQGITISLGTTVRRIAWCRGEVEIEAVRAYGESRAFRARAAVVTLPAGVLRHRGDGEVRFDPDLPKTKHDALDHIEMGHVAKVVMWFRTPFWEHVHDGRYRDGAFFYGNDLPFRAYWTQLPIRSEVVVAWIGGPKAAALGGATHESLVARALDGFGTLFGEPKLARNEFEAGLTHDWSADPLSRGAYSYLTVGGSEARAEFAKALDDTLFFGGEATSLDGLGGTVDGALESGERTAREVAKALA